MEISVPEGYEIEVVRPDQWEEILPVALNYYGSGEPLGKYVGLTIEDLEEMMTPLIKEWVADELSLVMRSKTTGTIAGVLIGKTIRKEDSLIWGEAKPKSEAGKFYIKVASMLERGVNVFEVFNVTAAVDHSLLAVHEDHQRKGLGQAMAKKLDEIGRNKGYKLAVVTATNVVTKIIYSKLGYEVLFELDYGSLEFNGKNLLHDLSVANGTKGGTILAKRL